ncbi:hypothetical protein Tco_0501739 [Tanacetum coccineum]
MVTSFAPTYDSEPDTVTKDDEMSKEKEIEKLMALISLSCKKIYKPTNNNLRTSSNTSRANQDNSPRINIGTRYDNQRAVNVAEARENVVEAEVRLNAEQADWKDDTDDESKDQELEAHYMYMAQIQEVTPDPIDNSGPIFDDEPMHKVQNNNDNYNVFAMENEHPESSNHIYLNKFCKPEFLKKAQRANPQRRSKLSDLIRPFDYDKLNNLYDWFVPQREKSAEQHYFPKLSKMCHTSSNKEFSKESFRKQSTLLEKRMDESIPWDQKCKSSKELFKIKKSVDTIFDGVERCKQTIAKRTYFGNIDPFIQNTIEGNFGPQISKLNADLEQFHSCLKEEMVADLRYFNSLEQEVDTLKSQLETQKTQFLNEIDRLSREYYYADHMNAILGIYTDLDEFTDLQCDYGETLEKCEHLEKELSKSKTMSKNFESLQKHAINLELDLQHCKEKIKQDKSFKENQSNVFLKEREQYFEIQDLKAQLQDKGIAISELKKLIEKMKGKSVETKFEKSSVIRQPNAFKRVIPNTSVSRPQLKSNHLEDRVMSNNSQGKKQEVEDHRRKFKFSNNKTSVTATRQPMAVPVSTRKPKHNVNQSVATFSKTTVAIDSTVKKSRNITDLMSKLVRHAVGDNSIHRRLWCSNTQTRNLKLLTNFVEKFLGTVKFGNDQIAPILGYGDLVQGTITIKRVYYVEGLNHNLFSVGQFYDADLEVAFRKSTCYIRDLKGNDLLTGSRGTDLYSISLQDSSTLNPICLMANSNIRLNLVMASRLLI